MLPLDSCAYVICSAGRGICASVVLEMIRRGNRREGGREGGRRRGEISWAVYLARKHQAAGRCLQIATSHRHCCTPGHGYSPGHPHIASAISGASATRLVTEGAKIAPSHREHSACLHSHAHAKSLQLCLMLCDAMDSCQASLSM